MEAESPETRSHILEADSLPGLVSLLASPSANAAENSISALLTLTFDRTAVDRLVEFAGISALILQIMSSNQTIQTLAVGIVRNMCSYEDVCDGVVSGNGISNLVSILIGSNKAAHEHAVVSLQSITNTTITAHACVKMEVCVLYIL